MSEPDKIPDPFQLCGTTIEGKYRVASVVGDGGFGVVYRAVHAGFGELIAVKCLKLPHALDEEQREGFLEQLREEGRLLHRLSKATPGIVQALDVGALTTPLGAWVPYLVLEWLEGETLADHLAARAERRAGPYPLEEAIRLLEPAARALAVAHAMKVAHRDVKPQNLFVTRIGGVDGASTLKVLDFGIAKVLTDLPHLHGGARRDQGGPRRLHAALRRAGAVQQAARRERAVDRRLRARAHPGRALDGQEGARGRRPDAALRGGGRPGAAARRRARAAPRPGRGRGACSRRRSRSSRKNRYPDAGRCSTRSSTPRASRRRSPRGGRRRRAPRPRARGWRRRSPRSPRSSRARSRRAPSTRQAPRATPLRRGDAAGPGRRPAGRARVGHRRRSRAWRRSRRLDPMSETPVLRAAPPAAEHLARRGRRARAAATAPGPKRRTAARPRSLWPLLGGALVLGGAAAAYELWGTGEAPHAPRTRARAASGFKTPILPAGTSAAARHAPPARAAAGARARSRGRAAGSTADMVLRRAAARSREGDAGRRSPWRAASTSTGPR